MTYVAYGVFVWSVFPRLFPSFLCFFLSLYFSLSLSLFLSFSCSLSLTFSGQKSIRPQKRSELSGWKCSEWVLDGLEVFVSFCLFLWLLSFGPLIQICRSPGERLGSLLKLFL